MSDLRPIIRRLKAAEDVEHHATYIADGSIDTALRFLERAEQTIKGLALFPSSGSLFPSRNPEFAGLRTKLVKDFPNHVVFYVERQDAIEVIRVLRGGHDMSVAVEEN
ncbi:Plasmid stabilization system protein [Roseimaritima multifibrata]|uniref:Plasmid stabilization system protein n=1 Tax=Roseimaritima multifibrata TaxID=1930274 RepID=A0A517M9M8_9BACT|nr:type II toxin-antitoxin system RelE/ParE family toxin [Roseimaritima multifibrata]QDS91595.1 Plasmid stabilization system protein [Roseimaritima multifibrata]